MALSGVIYDDIGAYWQLRGEWTATQNVSANTSTVTLKTYWLGKDGRGQVISGQTNPGSSTIEGTVDNFSASPSLDNGQKKLLQTQVKTITHNADGTFPNLDLAIFFDLDVTLSGTTYSSASASGSFALNTIPRESTLGVSADWTAGSNKTVSIKRFSTAFRHELEMYVKNRAGDNVHVQQVLFSTSETSKSTGFSAGDIENMFNQMDGRSTAPTYIILQTFNGDDHIGSTYYDGTITAPNASYTTSPASFTMGGNFAVTVTRENAGFTHTVRLKNGSTVLKTYTNVGTALTFDTASIKDDLIALSATADYVDLTLETLTYYGDELVRAARTETIRANFPGTPPVFSGTPTHKDTNAATIAITANDQVIISKKSTLRATVPVAMKATPQDGATMKEYIATFGGQSVTKAFSTTADVVFDFAVIDAKTNQSLVIKAVDSRGNSTLVTKVITIIPYDLPAVSVSANRINGFEDDTVLKLSGTLSSLSVGGVPKNNLVTARYRVKLANGTAWESYANFATAGFPGFSATDITRTLDKTNAYHVEFQVTDRLGTTTIQRTVNSGKPILMIDDRFGSVGAGGFPTKSDQFLMAMLLEFLPDQFASTAGAKILDMMNSDMKGLNSLFWKDPTNSDGEGLHFPHTAWDPNSSLVPPTNLRDTLRALDQVLYMNSVPIAYTGERILWEGSAFPNPDPYVVPFGRTLASLPTGIILVWSEYTTVAVNAGYQFTSIPKEIVPIPGTGIKVPLLDADNVLINKYIYINTDNLQAHATSSTAPNRTMVLRYVIGY